MPPRTETLPYRGQRPKLTTLPYTGQRPKLQQYGELAPAIDAYLSKRGSPMAGQGMAFLRAGRKFGIDPRMLVGIATIESGAGANMRLQYNPFNWGVHRGQQFGSWEESIMAVARGLRRNYLNQGLKTPQQIVSKYAPSSDGNDESNWAKVVGQVIRSLGGSATPAGAASLSQGGTTTLPPSLPQVATNGAQSVFDPQLFSRMLREQFISGGGRVDVTKLPQLRSSAYVQVPLTPQAAAQPEGQAPEIAAPKVPVVKGKGILAPASFKKTHDTSNLGWPAIDIMGKAGTPLRTPVAGVVVRHGSAQGGEAMYIDTNGDGEGDYWAGHITNMVPVGTKLRAGDVFAYISPDHAAPHLHWAKR